MSDKRIRLLKIADELADAAQRLGIVVRREKIQREVGYRVRGGECRLRDENLIIIDREMPPDDQIEVFAQALRGRAHEQFYLSPAARRVLQATTETA
jgi:hypothetical protein